MGLDHVKSVNVVDVPHEHKFILEYMVSSYSSSELMPVIISIFTEIGREAEPEFPSLTPLWESADYSEREMHDFFGVKYVGNSGMNAKFLLAPETQTPLRKDFKIAEESYVYDVNVPLNPEIGLTSDLKMPAPEELIYDSCWATSYRKWASEMDIEGEG
jgi:NADH-quinone oxidoreductase subunit B